MADLVDEDMDMDNSQNKGKYSDTYVEPVDYNSSQQTVDSFGTKMLKVQSSQGDGDSEKEVGGPPRRCPRLKDVEDVRIEDLAKKRAADKNDYGNLSNSPPDNDKSSLLHMSDMVGSDLGCSIEMVEHNLEIN